MLLDDALLVLLLPVVLLDLQVVIEWDDLFVGRLIEIVEAIAGVSIFVEALFKEILQITKLKMVRVGSAVVINSRATVLAQTLFSLVLVFLAGLELGVTVDELDKLEGRFFKYKS